MATRVLVAYGTRFGSTTAVAERIAERLRGRGCLVDLVPVGDVDGLDAYDAVVAGSPLFDGKWAPEATAFVREHREGLAARAVWLFSMGSFGDSHPVMGRFLKSGPSGLRETLSAIHPRGFRVFAGVIERSRWPWFGRLFYRAFGGRFGDNRDWPRIEGWADEIANALADG